jgi:hypothetical protein
MLAIIQLQISSYVLSKNIKIDKAVCFRLLLSVILDSCDWWCLILRCEQTGGI